MVYKRVGGGTVGGILDGEKDKSDRITINLS